MVAGNVVRVEDMEGRSLGGQVLRPTDDPRVVARAILRTAKTPSRSGPRSATPRTKNAAQRPGASARLVRPALRKSSPTVGPTVGRTLKS
jgi:hypothetical protein